MSSWRKLGVFITTLGVFLLALFVFSDIAKQPEFGLLLSGMAILVFGIFMLVTNPSTQSTPNPRFRKVKGHKNEPQPRGHPNDEKSTANGPSKNGGRSSKGGSPS